MGHMKKPCLNEANDEKKRHGATVTDGVQALGQRESATDNLNFALHSGAGAYEFRVRLADSRGEFAARTVALPDGTSATAPPAAVEYFRRMARMYRGRVRLHDPTSGRFDRLRTFLSLAAHNAYRSRDRGGLGAKAVLKDAFTIFFGPRTPFGGTQQAAVGVIPFYGMTALLAGSVILRGWIETPAAARRPEATATLRMAKSSR